MTTTHHDAMMNLDGVAPLHVIAAFDIGSNSIKMSVARLSPERGVEEFLWRAATTRLGEGIDETHQLAADRIDASLHALHEFVAEARRFGATRFIGVATEATRVTENGPALLDKVRSCLGIEVETITGDREAQLMFEGLDPAIERSGTLIVADIGGASTEIIHAVDGAVRKAVSLTIGSGRYTDRFVLSDPPLPEELAIVRAAASRALSTHPLPDACERLVITGGTAEYSRRLLDHEWPAFRHEIENLLDRLSRIPSAELGVQIQASEMRARVLPAGVAIAGALSDLTQPDVIYGAVSGIRTGLLHAAFRGEL